MLKKSVRAAAATLGAVALGVALTGAAFGSSDHAGNYKEVSDGFQCQSDGAGGNPGGTLITRISGQEHRPLNVDFRLSQALTYIQVEKYVGATWQNYDVSGANTAVLGQSRQKGNHIVAKFDYSPLNKPMHPQLSMAVGTSGLYRLVTWTALNNQDGLDLIPGHNAQVGPDGYRGYLISVSDGTCSFAG